MSGQLRPVTTTPVSPDIEAARKSIVAHVNAKLADEIAPAIKSDLLADINGRMAEIQAQQTAFINHAKDTAKARLHHERWRAAALAGIMGIGIGALGTWFLYSGAAFTGAAISATDRKLDRIEAEQGELNKMAQP